MTRLRRTARGARFPRAPLQALVLVVLALLLAATGRAADPLAGRTLVVGSEQDYPPFALGRTDAEADGFTVDLWKAVAREQKLAYTIRVRSFDELLREFKAGRIDVLLNLARSDDRLAFADFSVTHVEVGGAIFVRDGDRRIGAESDLASRSIIVLAGDLAHDYAIAQGWQRQLVPVHRAEDGLRLLASGRHDAMLIGKLAGLQTIRDQAIGGVHALDAKVGFAQRFAFAVRKGDAALLASVNEGLAIVKTRGGYDPLVEKWFGVHEPVVQALRALRPFAAVLAVVLGTAWTVAFVRRRRRDRRAAASLRESEERWSFALEGAGDGVWDADLATGTTLYSRRWKQMLGHDEAEIGTGPEEWTSRIHPDDKARALADNDACLRGRADEFHAEFRMRAKDGRWVWILDRGKVVRRAPDGRALRMIGTHADISARKAAETRAAAHARVMHAVATGSDLDAVLGAVAAELESATGWPCAIFVDDTKAWTGSPAAQRHAQAGGAVEPIVGPRGVRLGSLAALRSPGSEAPAAARDALVEAAQLAAIAIERHRDEQALRASEERLQRALEASRLALWDLDLGTGDVYLSDTWSEMLGGPAVPTRTDFDTLTSLVPEEDQPRIAAAMADALRGTTSSYVVEHRVRRPDGGTIWIRSQGRVVARDAAGRVRRAVGTNQDITERKAAEAAQGLLERQLREAQKLEAIGTLAGGIAHDFNNIMAAILGNLAFVRQDVDAGHPAQRYLEQIGKAGLRARTLVQQILAFSRRQADELSCEPLAPMLEEAASMLRSMAGPGVTLRTVLPARKVAAMVNPTQLQQVLMNLGTNAIQALRGGHGTIEIGLDEAHAGVGGSSHQPAAGSWALLWVRDDGSGMNDETRQHIFEPFFTTKPIGQGTGLGLAVAHGIVDAHRGVIAVESAPGRGSTFRVYLPLVDHESRPMPLEPEHGTKEVLGQGQHVLYVDDDEVMALMVQGLLGRLGYRATCVLDGREAVELVERDPHGVDLVVTDFNMPRMSGLDVAREMARIRASLPVAISSGYVSDELRSGASALGVRRILQKEHTLEELGPLVHGVLAARASASRTGWR